MQTGDQERQKVDRQNSWQQLKHAKLCSGLLQALQKEPLTDLDSEQGLNFCIRGSSWISFLELHPLPCLSRNEVQEQFEIFFFFFEVKLSNWKKESSGYVTEKQLSLDMLGMEMQLSCSVSYLHATEAGLIPQCSKGFFCQHQLSVQTVLWDLYSPHVQSHALASVGMLTIPNIGSHTFVRTHKNTACTVQEWVALLL